MRLCNLRMVKTRQAIAPPAKLVYKANCLCETIGPATSLVSVQRNSTMCFDGADTSGESHSSTQTTPVHWKALCWRRHQGNTRADTTADCTHVGLRRA